MSKVDKSDVAWRNIPITLTTGATMSHVRPRLSLPIKLLLLFAASAYLWTVGLALAPPNLRLPAPVVFLLCPACLLTITVDPSFPTVAFMLAPLNAIVYGLVGLGLGKVIRYS